MIRKIQTSCGKRKFYHQNDNNNQIEANNIIRPPTSHPYSRLNHYRSSQKIRNQYESNYFIGKLGDKKNVQRQTFQGLISKFKTSDEFNELPKNLKLIFTQLKVTLKSQILEDDIYKDIMLNLAKKIKQITDDNSQLRQKHQTKCKQLKFAQQNLQKTLIRQRQTTNSKQEIIKDVNGQNDNKKNNHSKDTKPNEFTLLLQNLHLTQLNQSYLNTIKQLQMGSSQQNTEIVKKQNRDSESSMEILRYHNRINYLQMKVSNNQKVQFNLAQENETNQTHIQELKTQIKQLKNEISNAKQKANQWRQRAFMQKQDSETNFNRQNFLLFSIKKLREVNKNLTNKILNLNNEGGKQLKQMEPNPYFQYEVDFFKSIKSVYYQAKFKEFKHSLAGKKDSFQLESLGLEEDYLEYRKHEQVNLVALNYFRPSFFSFIEQCTTNDIYTCRVKGSTSVSRVFIQVIRSILNCKINQFFMSANDSKFSKFPEFVFSWFQKYYFNSQKNKVSALQPYMQKPISQDLFYRDLMNVKLDQSWEIITFRQFLLQQLNLQELYFYLMCQNLLYKKAGITEDLLYTGQFCILVDFSAAKSVLDLVLSDFQSWNISFLTSKLRQKIVIKKNVQYIESGFFLRCVIQYYKIQRINRYKYIAKLCDQFKSCQQNGLRFSSFISVINRFTQISSQQKIKLYRDCFSVGKGKITVDVIFTVCTQNLIFLRYLKIKCFYRLPFAISNKDLKKLKRKPAEDDLQIDKVPKKQLICLQPADPYLYDIFIGLNRIFSDEENFTKRVQNFGVADLSNHFDLISKLLSAKSGNQDSSLLKCKHFIHFISQTINKIREISFQNFYELLDENNKKRSNSSFWIQIDQIQLCGFFTEEFTTTFKVFEKMNKYKIWKEKIYVFRLNNAAKKIQKQVRKKFIEPYLQLYKIIYADKNKLEAK